MKEGNRYRELKLLERAGLITGLQRQVKYELIPTQRINGKVVERPVTYIADFVYHKDGGLVVEDTKGSDLMIKIESVIVYGWEAAIRGMRNPKNSWAKSDTIFDGDRWCIGENDLKLMTALANAGTDHGKFLRMITVTADITAPLYWWKEFDTYKVGTVANSCSTMHKIHEKEFTLDDFSHEQMHDAFEASLKKLVDVLNVARNKFIETGSKRFWWDMIQLLPSSYNQRRTVLLNYAVLKNIYHARKEHKLDEWHTFCDWIETLPYSELITGKAAR